MSESCFPRQQLAGYPPSPLYPQMSVSYRFYGCFPFSASRVSNATFLRSGGIDLYLPRTNPDIRLHTRNSTLVDRSMGLSDYPHDIIPRALWLQTCQYDMRNLPCRREGEQA